MVCVGWILMYSRNVIAADQIEATKYPVATTVLVGGFVQFECNVLEPPGSNQTIGLQWFIEWDNDTEIERLLSASYIGEISVTDRPEFNGRGSYQTRYFMSTRPGGYKNHNCIMVVHSTTLEDNGYFGCTHQEPGETRHTPLGQKTRLTVVPQPTADPECNLNKHQSIFVLTCVSLHSAPPAHLTWYNEAGQNNSEAVHKFNSIEVKQVHDTIGRTFVCNAKQGNVEVGSCSITLTGPDGLKPTTSTSTISKTATDSQNKRFQHCCHCWWSAECCNSDSYFAFATVVV